MPRAQERKIDQPVTHIPQYHNTRQKAETMKKISFTDGKRLGM